MDDETLRLILTVLRLLGNGSTPREVEVQYLNAKKLIEDYHKSILEHPETDPRRY